AELSVGVVRQPLVKSPADSLCHTALDLPLQHERVDDASAVMDNDVLEDLEAKRLGVHAHIGGMAPRRPGRARGAVVAGRLETRLLAIAQRGPFAGLRSELRRR